MPEGSGSAPQEAQAGNKRKHSGNDQALPEPAPAAAAPVLALQHLPVGLAPHEPAMFQIVGLLAAPRVGALVVGGNLDLSAALSLVSTALSQLEPRVDCVFSIDSLQPPASNRLTIHVDLTLLLADGAVPSSYALLWRMLDQVSRQYAAVTGADQSAVLAALFRHIVTLNAV